ncbi:MAG: gliding motility-associated C-terminal domain-containing protein, partial [Bacteroidota bacterium]
DNVAEGETVVIEDLTADFYDLVVFDQTSNPGVIEPVTIEGIEIEAGVNIGVNGVPLSQPSCTGLSDGAVTVAITENSFDIPNPGPEFSYVWTNGAGDTLGTELILRDVPAGQYFVEVTKSGCTIGTSVGLSQPQPISITAQQQNDAVCPGIRNGSIFALIEFGDVSTSGTYLYRWQGEDVATANIATTPGDNTIALGGIGAGTYFVTVTDDNGCIGTAEFTINNEKEVDINLDNITDVTCFGGNDGLIAITGNTDGGTEELPYSFSWENLNGAIPSDTETSSTLTTLTAGTYIVTMEDNTMINIPGSENLRCTVRDTFELTEPERIQLDFTQTNASCLGNLIDGRIELEEPIGGTAPFTYEWDSLPNVTGRVAENLTLGDYKVVLTDANGCMDSLEFIITAPDLPRITEVSSDTLNCSSDIDGELSVDFENGTSGAVVTSFEWFNANGSTVATDRTATDLPPGVYVIEIKDTNGCFALDTGVVVAPDPLVLDSIAVVRPECPGFTNGEFTVFVSGGTAPLTYTNLTTNVSLNAPVFSALASGTYNIQVDDANGCPGLNEVITIEEPPSILVTFTEVDDTDCVQDQAPAGLCTGSAVASAILSDGTERTFDFQWGNGEQTVNAISSTATQLCEGVTTLIVQDDINENGCLVSVEVEIGNPPRIEVFNEITFVSCNGNNDGEITANVLGGTPDFQYEWSNGANGASITGLAPGSYALTVTDGNGCMNMQAMNIVVEEPDPIRLSVSDASQTVTCAGDEDGFIQLRVDGGNELGGAPFNWSGGVAGQRDSLAVSLSPGTYFVTVVDARGCTDSISYTIGEPSAIMATIPAPPEPACFGFQTNIIVTDASGGAGGPYSFAVNNLSKTTLAGSIPVFGGQEHMISVFDVRGCSFDTTIFVNQPPPVEVVLPEEIEIQLGDSLRLRPDVFSVAPIDTSTILWTPSEFLSTTGELNPIIRPFDSREYTLTLADLNGCTGEASVFIDVDKKRNVYIPNVFSPNSIRNSQFEIGFGAGVRQMNFMRIYDRWGELVYELGESGPSIGGIGDWDGTFNGRSLPSGVYVYLIEVEFEDNVTLLYRGDVTILY